MKADRKALLREFKERQPPPAGAFAVRDSVSGEVWVGASPNLPAKQTSLWMSLRQGSYPFPSLVQAWKRDGEGAFAFEVLEVLAPDPESTPYGQAAELKSLETAWRDKLGAARL